ncbi:MAG TPA: hypothetical protein VL101_15335 [Nordella sp.]|nr:hypothetical protein [Nordella sp.]
MKHRSPTLAAAVIAAGIISLGNPLMAKAMEHGTHEHHHDMNQFRHEHHHRQNNGYDGSYLNNCFYPHSYTDSDGYRHYCPVTGYMGYGMGY